MTDQKVKAIEPFVGNAIRTLYQMIVLVDEESSLCKVLDQDKELLNISIHDGDSFSLLCNSVLKNINPEDRDNFEIIMSQGTIHDVLSNMVHISMECRLRHSDSGYYWSRITVCNAKAENSPQGQEYLFLIQDIHSQRSKEINETRALLKELCKLRTDYDELFEENMTDSLTGCYNRKGLQYYETMTLEEAKKDGNSLFVCVLDLNGLKYLNDTYGHEAGDIGIKTVADALRLSVPKNSKIIRTGGDELLVFAALDSTSKEPEEMGSKIEQYLKDYNDSHSNQFNIAASYGYIFESVDPMTESLEKYIEIADEKMYRMKEETDPYKR